jgi:hypothetical protein
MEFKDLNENSYPDASLDLEGKLLNENFGKAVSESYDPVDLSQPLTAEK